MIEVYSEQEVTITQLNNRYYLKGIIDRFEKNKAVIKTMDEQEISWPIDQLPDGCQEGSVIRLIVSNSETDTQEREAIAKSILNQLLRIEKDD